MIEKNAAQGQKKGVWRLTCRPTQQRSCALGVRWGDKALNREQNSVVEYRTAGLRDTPRKLRLWVCSSQSRQRRQGEGELSVFTTESQSPNTQSVRKGRVGGLWGRGYAQWVWKQRVCDRRKMPKLRQMPKCPKAEECGTDWTVGRRKHGILEIVCIIRYIHINTYVHRYNEGARMLAIREQGRGHKP